MPACCRQLKGVSSTQASAAFLAFFRMAFRSGLPKPDVIQWCMFLGIVSGLMLRAAVSKIALTRFIGMPIVSMRAQSKSRSCPTVRFRSTGTGISSAMCMWCFPQARHCSTGFFT